VGMQSWIDDVLGEDIDLEPSSETDHGLTPESFAKLTDAILDKKHRELQDAMPRLREVGVEETDDRTAEEKNEARRKANLSKEIDLLGKKLEEKVIPTFTSLDDPNVNKLITYIENLDGIKSVDFSKDLAKGDKSSFKVVGNLGKSVTIDNGMSQAQIKKAILKAAGANDKQVNVFDFTKTDDKMIVGSDIIDVPNEFDIFKRQ